MSSAADTAQASQSARVKANFRASMTQESAMHGGLLEKRSSGLVRRWQRRFFSLRGCSLMYSADRDQSRAERIRSTVDVAGAEVDLRDMGEFVVTLKGGDCVQLRTLVGQRQAEEASRWSQKLLLASNEVDDRARATAEILRIAEAGERGDSQFGIYHGSGHSYGYVTCIY